jgi:hypothetical protein
MKPAIDVFVVTRSYDWDSYGSGMEIEEVFTERAAADAYVEAANMNETGTYAYTYEVVTKTVKSA